MRVDLGKCYAERIGHISKLEGAGQRFNSAPRRSANELPNRRPRTLLFRRVQGASRSYSDAELDAAVVAAVVAVFPGLGDNWLAIVFVSGIALFALAMRWDTSDPRRTTRRSGVTFWLHLSAALPRRSGFRV